MSEVAPTHDTEDFSWYDQFVKEFVVPAVEASNKLGDKFVPIVFCWLLPSSSGRNLRYSLCEVAEGDLGQGGSL